VIAERVITTPKEKHLRLSRNPATWLSIAWSLALLLAVSLPAAAFASGGSSGGGTPGPCLTINVPSSTFTFNVGGDVTLKADILNCSSDTTASQLIVTFQTIGGGYWCVYPESAGNPPNFSVSPGNTKSLSCTGNAAINGSFAGFPAVAQVYANCQSFSTQKQGAVILNLDGTRFLPPDQGFSNSSCALVATSNTYTVVSGINQNGVPRK
jgi:hypothetical protein